jgi:hypothetical protein
MIVIAPGGLASYKFEWVAGALKGTPPDPLAKSARCATESAVPYAPGKVQVHVPLDLPQAHGLPSETIVEVEVTP